MSPRKHILLIAKTSKVTLLSDQDLARLQESGAANAESLRTGQFEHNKSLDLIRSTLSQHDVCERRVEELHSQDVIGKDLIVSVGGDGTVLAVSGLISNTPIIAVNSDPSRSVGNYTRCNRDQFADRFHAWLDDEHHIEQIPRLIVDIDGDRQQYRILNDCLFTNNNPAAMTRYTISVDGVSEQQFSSGVWISSSAGSTGAIHSAGMPSVPAQDPALLFKVREPFTRRGSINICEGTQVPPRGLQLTTGIPGIHLYIDGAHQCKILQPGTRISFSACPHPLLLVTDKPSTP